MINKKLPTHVIIGLWLGYITIAMTPGLLLTWALQQFDERDSHADLRILIALLITIVWSIEVIDLTKKASAWATRRHLDQPKDKEE